MENRMRVLVTGAGTGIGRGIALYFARRGAKIAVHCSHSTRGANEVVRKITAAGGDAKVFQADFLDSYAVKRLAEESSQWLGGIDVLVNNAGITLNEPFAATTAEEFDTLYTVNVRSPYFLIQHLLPQLKESRGRVVNLTSIHGIRGMQEHSVYAGTKGAIIAYTRALAIELAVHGIRVNAVAPGSVVVENYEKACDSYDPEETGRRIPAGFAAEPEDIAALVWFLSSEEARFIVGQTIVTDGGTSSLLAFTDSFRKPLTDHFGSGYVSRS